MINYIELLTGATDSISLDGTYEIPKYLYKDSFVKDLDKVEVSGNLEKDALDDVNINIKAKGKMLISDSVTLEDVWFPFSFEVVEKVEEFGQKDKNSLDIIEFLWQNIVLEVPLRYTKVENYDKYQGDGWKLVSEEDLSNNPFRELLNNKDGSD